MDINFFETKDKTKYIRLILGLLLLAHAYFYLHFVAYP